MLPDLIPSPLANALAERGYTDLTPVQAAVIAPEAAGRDLLVSARTGSGKTVAFGLGIAPTLLQGSDRFASADTPLALVIAPTRELAMQVQRELAWLYAPAGGRVIATVGGMDPRRERRLLEGGCHIVVGTPGRLRDHVERKALDLSGLAAIVLDEADEMLDMGFKEDLTFLLAAAPKERRTLLFSATIPKAIAMLAQDFQRDAFRIAAASGEAGHADISYVAMQIGPRDTEKAVVNILREKDAEAAIIFCRTRESVKRLHAHLTERGFTAVCLSGELSQGERNHALQALRDGRAKVCVATDVAARGIDLPHLSLVIHADLPTNAEVLQHRSGRTGRAGRKGTSILLAPAAARRRTERLLAEAKIRATWGHPPDADAIRARDRERFLKDPLLIEETTDDDRAMGEALLKERSPEDVAAILARLYRARLPEPEDLSTTGAETFDDRPGRKRSERFERDDRPERHDRFAKRERTPRDADDAGQRFERRERDEPRPELGRPDNVVFRLNVGRRDRADPKWLLPMLCNRGGVTRKDIGAIRIFEETTEFEVSGGAAGDFARNAAEGVGEDITISPADGAPAEKPARHGRDERPRGDFVKPFKPPFRPKKAFDRPTSGSTGYGSPDAREDRARPPRRHDDRPDAAAATTKTDYPSKKRFSPGSPPPKGPDRGPATASKHARSGFMHRKGQKRGPGRE